MADILAVLWPIALIAAAIGLATGWWIWGGAQDEEAASPVFEPMPPPIELDAEAELEAEAEIEAAAEPEPAPEPEPEPEMEAEPEPIPVANLADPPRQVEEPVEEAPQPEAEPVPEPAETASPFLSAPDGEPDNLTRIKGVGPKLADLLHSLGVYHFRQIAGWSEDQVAEVDSHLETFRGRIARDRWVDQAELLADRNVAAFEREFGKLSGPI